MNLIKNFLMGKKQDVEKRPHTFLDELKLEAELYHYDKENIFKQEIFKIKDSEIKILEYIEMERLIRQIKVNDRVLYEENYSGNQLRELVIRENTQRNNPIFIERRSETGKIISKKVESNKQLRSMFAENITKKDSNINLILSEDLHLYINMLDNRYDIWSREKEQRKVCVFNEDHNLIESKIESIKRISLLNGLMKLFEGKKPLEYQENATFIAEYKDDNIGRLTILLNYDRTLYTFFNNKNEKVLEEEHKTGKRVGLKMFEKGICRYQEEYNLEDKKVSFYNKDGLLRLSNTYKTTNYEHYPFVREKELYPESKKNRKLLKEQREVQNFRLKFEIAGKEIQILPNKMSFYRDENNNQQMFLIRDVMTERECDRFASTVKLNMEKLKLNEELEKKKENSFLNRITKRIKPA